MQAERLALPCPDSDCAECGSTDCTMRSFRWFRSDDETIHGFVTISITSGTFSTAGAPLSGAWELDGTDLTADGQSGDLTCNETEMTWDGRIWVRAADAAEQDFSSAHEHRESNGSWRGQPYSAE